MTSVTTVFARRNDSGNFSILDNDSGHPATRLDASVYPVGSDLGARYEHARGINLTREDVIAAGIEFENRSDADEPAPPAPTEFFVAVPADDQASGIHGIGLTHEAALLDVTSRSGWTSPRISRDEDGQWVVTTDDGADPAHFPEWDETEARDYAAQKGFVALPCTERLYRYIEENEVPSRWTTNAAGFEDLDLDEDELSDIADRVTVQFGDDHDEARAGWMAEDAYSDAVSFVDCYVRDANGDPVAKPYTEMHTALCLIVRDLFLAQIAERDAA